jgi:hypothetical protein
LESFRVAVRRQPGESASAWRERAAARARVEAEEKGLQVHALELRGSRGSPMVSREHSGVIEVTVRGERAGRHGASA